MASLKLDPIDNFYWVGSSLIGRFLLFFLSGWVGILLGRIALEFDEWSDFVDPAESIAGIFRDTTLGEEALVFVAWPYLVILGFLSISVLLGLLAAVLLLWAFFTFILDDEPSPMIWLGFVAVTSLALIFSAGPSVSRSSAFLFIFLWVGLSAAAWWALQVYHPEVIEKADDLLHGRKPSQKMLTPRRKISQKVWGKPVRGWDGEPVESGKTDDPKS